MEGKINFKACLPSRIVGDNKIHIIDLVPNREVNCDITIPLDNVYMIETIENLTEFGFEKIEGNTWGNLKYKGELWK